MYKLETHVGQSPEEFAWAIHAWDEVAVELHLDVVMTEWEDAYSPEDKEDGALGSHST